MNEKDLELEELSLEEIMREFGSTEEMAEPVDAQELLDMFDSAAEPETVTEPENEQAEGSYGRGSPCRSVGGSSCKSTGGKNGRNV